MCRHSVGRSFFFNFLADMLRTANSLRNVVICHISLEACLCEKEVLPIDNFYHIQVVSISTQRWGLNVQLVKQS